MKRLPLIDFMALVLTPLFSGNVLAKGSVAFSRTVANGDVCLCPKCNKESMGFNV